MSRLNQFIKLIVIMGEGFFLVTSAGIAVMSWLVFSGKFVAFDFAAAKEAGVVVFLASLLIFICTVCGCFGAFQQIVRKGCLTGRRVLSIHQAMLISVLIFSCKYGNSLQNRRMSLELVIEQTANYPHYDLFEKSVDRYFNSAYFESTCADKPSDAWTLKWVDAHCPNTMHQKKCALEKEKLTTCDTSCKSRIWNEDLCCPSEKLCKEGNIKACPYNQCRVQALVQVLRMVKPLVLLLLFFRYLSIVMVVFTCLLICYNPRDDMTDELVKTGVMTKEDAEETKRVRKSKKYAKGKQKTDSEIEIETIRDSVLGRNAESSNKPTERRHSVVSNMVDTLSLRGTRRSSSIRAQKVYP